MSAPAPARPRATYQDLLKVPEPFIAQILDGELVVLPRPTGEHASASGALMATLGATYGRGDPPGGWWIRYEVELQLDEQIVVPDLSGWRRGRLPRPPSGPFTTLAPDWVCEVLSPSTARIDRVRKMRIYAREGVRFGWLVDPDGRTLEVFGNEGGRWVTLAAFGGDELVRAEPFPDVEIDLLLLWGEERAAPPPETPAP